MGLTRNEPIFAALESTYNDGTVPAGADAILAQSPQFDPVANANFTERETVRAGTLAKPAGIYGGAAPTLNFSVELKGSGSLGVAPEWGRLLRACGFVETINPGVSVVYTPRPANTTFESLAIHHWWANKRYVLGGIRGNVVLNASVGQVPLLEFTFTCRMADGSHGDVAQYTPVYDTTVPVAFRGDNFLAVGGFNPAFTELSIDPQWTTAISQNANAADGYGEIRVTERQVSVSLDPEDTDVATKDWLGAIQTNASEALSLTHGSVAGNRVNIAMPALRPNTHGAGDRDGVRTIDYGYIADETAALNDEITITLD